MTDKQPAPEWTDRALLDWYVQQYATRGWQVTSHTETAAQLRKPKQWSTPGVLLFVALPAIVGLFWWPFFVAALVGFLIVLADYLTKRDEMLYLTASDARARAEREWGH